MRIIGLEPEGCSLRRERYRRHRIQGLAISYVPANLDLGLLDEVASVSEIEAIDGMRALMRAEGICAGVSTGANIAAALRVADQLPVGGTVLTFAYDGTHDYLDLLQQTEAEPRRAFGDHPHELVDATAQLGRHGTGILAQRCVARLLGLLPGRWRPAS